MELLNCMIGDKFKFLVILKNYRIQSRSKCGFSVVERQFRNFRIFEMMRTERYLMKLELLAWLELLDIQNVVFLS